VSRVSAKLKLQAKQDQGNQVGLTFSPDYEDGRNAEWAEATPTLSLAMTVKADVGALFEAGKCYDMYLEEQDTTGNEAPAGEKLAE
jgi:hypothetical protein